jgi:hypothetical protein
VPTAIGLAGLALLGVLVAKPWDSPPPTPSASANAALAAPSPFATATPETTPSPTMTSTPVPLPTADIAPLGPAGEFALSAPPDSALARCTYTRARGGVRYLRSVEVQPPTVMLDPRARASDINRIGWRFELEMNRRERLFDRDWETVDQSRRQIASTAAGRQAAFTPLTVRYHADAIEDTSIFRVRVIIEWYTRNFEIAGRAEVVANRYQEGGDELIGSWPLHCSGVRVTR